jgi:hypothetical protein
MNTLHYFCNCYYRERHLLIYTERYDFGPGLPVKVSRKFLEKLLHTYGSLQLDELISNITLAFLQSVTQMPKAGFSTRDLEF